MKLVLFALLGLVMATTPTKGEVIVDQLMGLELDGEVFIIMFYSPSCCPGKDQTLNADVKTGL